MVFAGYLRYVQLDAAPGTAAPSPAPIMLTAKPTIDRPPAMSGPGVKLPGNAFPCMQVELEVGRAPGCFYAGSSKNARVLAAVCSHSSPAGWPRRSARNRAVCSKLAGSLGKRLRNGLGAR